MNQTKLSILGPASKEAVPSKKEDPMNLSRFLAPHALGSLAFVRMAVIPMAFLLLSGNAYAQDAAAQGTVSIASTPPGAKIFIDGKDIEKVTPITDMKLSAGAHKIQVVSTDGMAKEVSFTLEAGGMANLNLEMAPAGSPEATAAAAAATAGASAADAATATTGDAAAAAGDAVDATAGAAGDAATATKDAAGDAADAVADTAGDAVDAAGDAASATADAAGDAATATKDAAGDAADAVADTAGDAVDAAGDAADATGEAVSDTADAVADAVLPDDDAWTWLSVAGWATFGVGAMAVIAGAVIFTTDTDPLQGPLGIGLIGVGVGLALLGGVLLYVDEELPNMMGSDEPEAEADVAPATRLSWALLE